MANPFIGKFGGQFGSPQFIINMMQQQTHQHQGGAHMSQQYVFQNRPQNSPFEFDRPKFDYDALSKYGFLKEDMKEHIVYAKKLHSELTTLVKKQKQLFKHPNLEDLCTNFEGKASLLAAEVFSHNLFFNLLTPNGGDKLFQRSQCKDRLSNEFESFDGLKKQFEKVAMEFNGAGWIYLYANKEEAYSKIEVVAFKEGQNPLKIGHSPLLCIDLWEHAFFGNPKWRGDEGKKEYLNAFWKCIDWNYVDIMYDKAFPRFPAFGMMGGF